MDKLVPPKIENAPGLTWRKHKYRWEARWLARSDLVKRGYPISVYRLWLGYLEPGLSDERIKWLQDCCNALQNEMLVWGRGGVPTNVTFDGTVSSLIACYKSDKLSDYRKLRHHSRTNYDSLLKRIDKDFGKCRISELNARRVREWHAGFLETGKVSMGHSVVQMLRTMVNFGVAFLEDDDCAKLGVIIKALRFKMAGRRSERLTVDQVNALRAEAHAEGWHSIALTNAFQFECILRQKDLIGEYVPLSEPIVSEHIYGNEKWARGIQWQEIDANLVLVHTTSKKQKPITIPLRKAEMVMEEFCRIAGAESPDQLTRDMLPASGPMVIKDNEGRPWPAYTFRITWRKLATAAGIPKHIRNMDSRAGGITEAIESDAPLEHVRHAATHSDIQTTQGYDRAQERSVIRVLDSRMKHRNKTGT